MLLITRRSGEAIVINGTIEVKVLEVKSGRVKLGFEYPQGSSVFRQELFAKIQEENKAAALNSTVVTTPAKALTEVVRNLHSTGRSATSAKTETDKDAIHDPSGSDNRKTR